MIGLNRGGLLTSNGPIPRRPDESGSGSFQFILICSITRDNQRTGARLRARNPVEYQEPSHVLAAALLPLARVMLEERFSAVDLVRAAKLSYVHAAMAQLASLGARTNISRLAVVTGLTRKEIAAYLRLAPPTDQRSPRQRLEHRAFRVVRGWCADPLYSNTSGRPADLPIDGSYGDFASLVRAYGGDVTPKTVLKELERMGAAVRTASGNVRLRNRAMKSMRRAPQGIIEFAQLLADFTDTASQVLKPKRQPVYFTFRKLDLPTQRQVSLFERVFARRAAALAVGADQWFARQRDCSVSKPDKRDRSGRVGLGIYLVRSGDSAEALPQARRVRKTARKRQTDRA